MGGARAAGWATPGRAFSAHTPRLAVCDGLPTVRAAVFAWTARCLVDGRAAVGSPKISYPRSRRWQSAPFSVREECADCRRRPVGESCEAYCNSRDCSQAAKVIVDELLREAPWLIRRVCLPLLAACGIINGG